MTIISRVDFDVELVEHAGSDEMICRAARVSTLGAASLETLESAGLIKFLMSNRHGTPFEHSMMTFRISAPIFVWREFMRHRIGISYNEESGRYKELDGVFYIPPRKRNLVQVGKPGHYTFEIGSQAQYDTMTHALWVSYGHAWDAYQKQLGFGIAKEVARMCLPVAIYSTAYVTMNPRSMMNFLTLRTKHDDSKFPSFPMWEINQVANQMEDIFRGLFPLTHTAFVDSGRVAP
jgi:thymidylate synthase (FAD)